MGFNPPVAPVVDQKLARWKKSGYCVVPTLVPPTVHGVFTKIGDARSNDAGLVAEQLPFAVGSKTVPSENLRIIGTIGDAIVVLGDA